MKRIVLTGVFVVVLMCMHSVSFADVTAVFGPKVYARGKGKPAVAVDAFSAAAGVGRLTVYNGDGNKKHAVSSGRIEVNGAPILTPRDFKGHAGTVEETIDLVDDNTITVALDGKPGAFLTVVITQKSQASPPTVTIAAAPSVIHKGGSATLSWSV